MKKGIFKGTSTIGSIEEAITNAIDAAKQGLNSELVTWKLDTIGGENGGIVGVNTITVSLKTKANKDKKKEIKAAKTKEIKTKDKAAKAKEVEVKEVKLKEVKTIAIKAKK